MRKSPLSMTPTGWFQAAWSVDVGVGEVRRMHYFGRELVAYRGRSGEVHVMDAYCEHLGAHLGHGGTVSGDNIVCPFHGWEWDGEGRNVCVPYQDRPNKARRIPSWPVRELNESIYIWHDVLGREPFYELPDVFTEAYPDAVTEEDSYYRSHPHGHVHRERLAMHPQFVAENSVDFAHFKFVHRADDVPRLTRQVFGEHCLHTDFTMTFGKGKKSTVQTPDGPVEGGVDAILFGCSAVYAKFWGPDSMRTIVTVTPVDDETSDIRSTVWLERRPGDSRELPESAHRRMKLANNQFLADVNIWAHQRYTDPPALATSEARGFRELRRWITQWYPEQTGTATGGARTASPIRA